MKKTVFALLFASAALAAPPKETPQPKMVMTPLSDSAKVPIREIQVRLYSAQEALQKAVLGCMPCLQAQYNVNALAQAVADQIKDASKTAGCVGSLDPESLSCQKPEAAAEPKQVKP